MKNLLLWVFVVGIVVYVFCSPDQSAWAAASRTGTIRAFGSYLLDRPQGKHSAEAKGRILTLGADDTPFRSASNQDTRGALEHFLVDYPGHHREAEARSLLASNDIGPQGIASLLDANKIEIRVNGAGIENANIQIRRRVDHVLKVRIIPGVLFVPRRASAQTMISTDQKDASLEGPDWISVEGYPSRAQIWLRTFLNRTIRCRSGVRRTPI